MAKIEFVSYDGKWPSLCHGTLKVKIDDKEYSIKDGICSGGSVTFDSSWQEDVENGPWFLDEEWLPKNIRQYVKEITALLNENVTFGCCGGCI